MNIYGKSVSSTAAALYGVLCSLARTSQRTGHIDRRGAYVFASRRQLGEYIERSERTAQRLITELKAAGLIHVRRMGLHSHDRIYIIASDGGSEHDKNGGSEITRKSNNIKQDISILQHKAPQMAANAADDAKIVEVSARIAAPAVEKVKADGLRDGKKSKPTPKRHARITRAAKEAAREKYRRQLVKRLGLDNKCWAGFEDEYSQLQALVNLISEAMAVPGRQIRVNGAGLNIEQYWYVVQHISRGAVSDLFERIHTAEITTGVRNIRAYTLAAVYNAVQWAELQGASAV